MPFNSDQEDYFGLLVLILCILGFMVMGLSMASKLNLK